MNTIDAEQMLRVAYAAADRYAKYLGIFLLSLLQAHRAFKQIECYAFDCGIEDLNRKRLQDIPTDYRFRLSFLSINHIEEKQSLQRAAYTIVKAAYVRFFPPCFRRMWRSYCFWIVTHWLPLCRIPFYLSWFPSVP